MAFAKNKPGRSLCSRADYTNEDLAQVMDFE